MTKSTKRFEIPYPDENSDPFFLTFFNMINKLDQLHFSAHEERNMVLYSDGGASWNYSGGSYVLTFFDNINFISPTFGRTLYLPVSGLLEIGIPVNHYLVFELSRGATNDVDLSTSYSVMSQLPVDANDRILCYHAANHKLYFITGLVLDIGESSVSLAPEGSGGVTELTDLIDTPSDYSGHAGDILKVKEDETGVEFFDPGANYEMIKVDPVTPVSTTEIPEGAMILEIILHVITAYNSGVTIEVFLNSGSSAITLMPTDRNDPQSVGDNIERSSHTVLPAESGAVTMNIIGTVTTGDAFVLVKYVNSLLS